MHDETNIPTSLDSENENSFLCSEKEKKLLEAYRSKPEMRQEVDKLLGIEEYAEDFLEENA